MKVQLVIRETHDDNYTTNSNHDNRNNNHENMYLIVIVSV